MSPTALTCAVCIYPQLTPSDYQGPIELFSFIAPDSPVLAHFGWAPSHTIKVDYLAAGAEPVKGTSGPLLVPTRTFGSVKPEETYDLIVVPGGIGSRPDHPQTELLKFLREFAPKAKYVLSICTGSELLARAGWLDGKKATTNKSGFKRIAEDYPKTEWIPRARWVVDGNTWTSSGVTAGADMGYAFLVHLVGKDIAESVRGIVELSVHKQDDDEFADFYHLV